MFSTRAYGAGPDTQLFGDSLVWDGAWLPLGLGSRRADRPRSDS